MLNKCFFPSCTLLGEEERESEDQRWGRVAGCCSQDGIFWGLLSTVVPDNGAMSHLGSLPPTLGLVRVQWGPP